MAKAGPLGKRSNGFLSDIVGGDVLVNTPNGVVTSSRSNDKAFGGEVIEDYAGKRQKGGRSGTPSRTTNWPGGNRSGE